MKRLFDLESPLMSGLIKLFDCICLSVLWLVCCIPLVTAGAASAALYTTVFKYIRREEGTLAATYFGAFKENFRRSTLAGLVSLALLAVLVLDALVFRSLRLSGSAMGSFYGASLVLIGIALTWMIYLAAYSARFNGSVRDVLRWSFVLMVIHPLRALEVFAVLAAGVALAKAGGALISFDPNLRPPLWSSLEKARSQIAWGLSQCDVLKIADNELEFMTGQTDFAKGAAMLQQQYPNIRLLNVTAGAQGSYAFCGSLQAFEPGCTLGGVIETTGAGDTFCACVLHYLLGRSPDSLTRDDLHRMLHFANTAAYLVTTRKGAIRSMPTPEQVQAIL